MSCTKDSEHSLPLPQQAVQTPASSPTQPAPPSTDQSLPHSSIKADEEVLLFPTLANRQGETWEIPIHGWIYEPERDDWLRNPLVHQLRDLIDIDDDELQSGIFTQRFYPFIADNERGKQISIRIGEQIMILPESKEDGHFYGLIHIHEKQAVSLVSHGILQFTAISQINDPRTFTGHTFLISQPALMVISDIDDTVKISQVRDKKLLLENTFLKPFQPVPGMAETYRRWASQRNAHIHFVSSSPWQLFVPLRELLEQAGFPPASLDLKNFRAKDTSILSLFADPEQTKVASITPILQTFSQSKFILVGDSGEKDPEVYAELAKSYPLQIEKILIRDVTGEVPEGPRYRAVFAGIPRERWQIFKEAHELP